MGVLGCLPPVRQRYRLRVLVHAYLGALVFGGVLLAASLLVGGRGKMRVRSLAFWGFALSFFGLGTIGLRLTGALSETSVPIAGAALGLCVAALVLCLSRRRKAG